MPLELAPSLESFSRKELEKLIEDKQVRRMQAAVIYADGVNNKLAKEGDKLERKFQQQLAMLGKEMNAFDKAFTKLNARLDNIEQLQQELGLVNDMTIIMNKNGGSDE